MTDVDPRSRPARTGRSASPPTQRVVRLLSYLAGRPTESLSLAELARGTGTNKATCSAILAELVEAGWVARTGGRPSYTLGGALAPLGRAAEVANPGLRPGREALVELGRRADVLCSLLVRLEGERLVVVASHGDTALLGAAAEPGASMPCRPPIGIGVMAWSAPDEVDAWFGRSPTPLTDADRSWFRANFAQMRHHGYAVTRLDDSAPRVQELLARLADDPVALAARPALRTVSRRLLRDAHELDGDHEGLLLVAAVTAPVFGPDGRPSLIISSRPRRAEMTRDELVDLGRAVAAATAQAMLESGGRPPGAGLG